MCEYTVPDIHVPIQVLEWICCQFLPPGANVIKLFTAVIYHHSMVIPSFCVIKLYYLGNYSWMAVNYHGIWTLEKVRLKLPQCCFITLAPGNMGLRYVLQLLCGENHKIAYNSTTNKAIEKISTDLEFL